MRRQSGDGGNTLVVQMRGDVVIAHPHGVKPMIARCFHLLYELLETDDRGFFTGICSRQRQTYFHVDSSRWQRYQCGDGNMPLGRVTMILCVHSLHMKIANMKRTTWLMRFLSPRQCTPGLSCEGSNHASECFLSAGPRLLKRQ